MRGVRLVIALAASVAALVSAPAARAQEKTAKADEDPLSRAGEARTIGSDTARVTLIEFFDFSCPVCQTFHATRRDSLVRAVGPDVHIAYLSYFITDHMRGFHAAQAAICAAFVGGQKAYTAMADKLFMHASEWSEAFDPGPTFTRYGSEIGVNGPAFADCRARDAAAPLLLADLDLAGKFGITGTPTFIILPRGATSPDDALRISGNASIAAIMDLVTQARAKAK